MNSYKLLLTICLFVIGSKNFCQTIENKNLLDSVSFLKLYYKIEKISSIGHYLQGKDSINIYNKYDCITLNPIKHSFYKQGDSSVFNKAGTIIEFRLKKRVKSTLVPSAAIFEISFSSAVDCDTWFDIYNNLKNKRSIEGKPRTGLFKINNKIYLIQTYHDGGSRSILENIKKYLMNELSN